jgi:hypothetical protein
VRNGGTVEHISDKHIEDSAARVISQFEDWKTRIEQSFQESDDFRSLCEDYAVCARALENWQASDSAVAVQRQKEYTELLAELEREIRSWLEQHNVADQSD